MGGKLRVLQLVMWQLLVCITESCEMKSGTWVLLPRQVLPLPKLFYTAKVEGCQKKKQAFVLLHCVYRRRRA